MLQVRVNQYFFFTILLGKKVNSQQSDKKGKGGIRTPLSSHSNYQHKRIQWRARKC